MHKPFSYFITMIFITSVMLSCNSSKKNMDQTNATKEDPASPSNSQAGPPAIIYKTKSDYYDKVPVTLSEDKSKVVSYPGSRDVYYKGNLAYPTKLNDGFLLDNRGIDENVAFLDITYEVFSKSMRVYSAEELHKMILDDDPITEMYDCGSKYKFKDLEAELNSAIDNGKLSTFKKLK